MEISGTPTQQTAKPCERITTRIRAHIMANGYDTRPFGQPRNGFEETANAIAEERGHHCVVIPFRGKA